ncbi:MAG: hypothetical protein ACLFP4_00880 [Spirochaetales bacterium]
MKESIIKLTLALVALAGLAFGGTLGLIPDWYITLSESESVNLAWLRMLGAGMFSVQGIGLLVATFRRKDTTPIILQVALLSTAQSVAGWYSLFAGEFSAVAQWALIVPLLFATITSVLLWFIWVSRRRSRKGGVPAGSQSSHSGAASVSDQSAGYPAEEPAPGYSADEFTEDTVQDTRKE